MKIPDKEDWGSCDDFDCQSAYDSFFGKSNEVMMFTYRSNPIASCTDIRFMPTKPFQYYFIGYKNFVLNAKSHKLISAESGHCFLMLVDFKLKTAPQDILPLWDDIFSAIKFVAHNQELYLAPLDIYGDFVELFDEIKTLAKQLGAVFADK